MSEENRVYLIQLLCPQRHAIMALAFESPKMPDTSPEALEVVTSEIRRLMPPNTNPWCGLCGALENTWNVELRVTGWQSLAEAAPHLRECERQQQESAAVIKAMQRQARNN